MLHPCPWQKLTEIKVQGFKNLVSKWMYSLWLNFTFVILAGVMKHRRISLESSVSLYWQTQKLQTIPLRERNTVGAETMWNNRSSLLAGVSATWRSISWWRQISWDPNLWEDCVIFSSCFLLRYHNSTPRREKPPSPSVRSTLMTSQIFWLPWYFSCGRKARRMRVVFHC